MGVSGLLGAEKGGTGGADPGIGGGAPVGIDGGGVDGAFEELVTLFAEALETLRMVSFLGLEGIVGGAFLPAI